jgi:D-methionine transport system substrate-binding protein
MKARRLLFAALASLSMAFAHAADSDKPLRVGVTAGPHAQILEQVKVVAARDGLTIKIFEFSDYVQPNAALAAGDLDANIYQHLPYLENAKKDRGYDLVAIGQAIIFPMGIYSKKFKSIDLIPSGGRIAIPNDPTNGGRALLLLQAKGLLKLKADAGLKATPLDIVDNPKKLKIVELDAAQLPRAVDEVDAAVINTNYALPAGLVPTRDALALENPHSPYANVIVVRGKDRDNPVFQKLVRAYQNDEIKQFIRKTFQDSVVPAW